MPIVLFFYYLNTLVKTKLRNLNFKEFIKNKYFCNNFKIPFLLRNNILFKKIVVFFNNNYVTFILQFYGGYMKKLYKGFLALITVGFLSAPTIAAPVELHYWHGHTGKLEAIINEIADRWNASQDESMLIPTSKGSYEDILAAFIAAYRAGEHPHMVQVYDAGAAIMVAQVKNGVVYPFEDRGNY